MARRGLALCRQFLSLVLGSASVELFLVFEVIDPVTNGHERWGPETDEDSKSLTVGCIAVIL